MFSTAHAYGARHLFREMSLLQKTESVLSATWCRQRNVHSHRAKILDGRKIAAQIHAEIRADTRRWEGKGHRRPHLAVVLVGDDPASAIYVANKLKAAQDTGITSETIRLPASTPEHALLRLIRALNADARTDGVLLQLPLPAHVDERRVCHALAPHKDVDGFHAANVGRMALGVHGALLPCTPLGVMEMLRRTGIETFGKNAVVVGRSKNVGMPMAMLLHADGMGETQAGGDATVTICHRHTPSSRLVELTRLADVLVAACGVPRLITAPMVKEGAVVVDVGISRIKDPRTGKNTLVGDVDFEGVSRVASHITPVPGGVGPMTVAMLMHNTLQAARRGRAMREGPEADAAAWDEEEENASYSFVI